LPSALAQKFWGDAAHQSYSANFDLSRLERIGVTKSSSVACDHFIIFTREVAGYEDQRNKTMRSVSAVAMRHPVISKPNAILIAVLDFERSV